MTDDWLDLDPATIQINPCPFCNELADIRENHPFNGSSFNIKCSSLYRCGAQLGPFNSFKAAIDMWNNASTLPVCSKTCSCLERYWFRVPEKHQRDAYNIYYWNCDACGSTLTHLPDPEESARLAEKG